MNRAVLWLVGGLVVLALAVVAIAPELVGDAAVGSVLGLALVAIVPAALVAALYASIRRRRRDEPPSDPGA